MTMQVYILNSLPASASPLYIYYLKTDGKYYGWDAENLRFYNLSTPNLNDVEGISFDNLVEGDVLSYDSATQTWINKIPETSSGVNSFNERQGDVYLESGDITYALEYTPENIANKVTIIVPELINDTEYPSTSAVYNYVGSAITKSYGAWKNDETQYAANNTEGFGVRFNTIDISDHGISIEPDLTDNKTLIKFSNAGTYNIQFSLQFENVDANFYDVSIWLRKNGQDSGSDIGGTARYITIPNKYNEINGHTTAAFNYVIEVVAEDYFQLVWATTNSETISMKSYKALSPTTNCYSSILTVSQIN
jgi:hypothetical protein